MHLHRSTLTYPDNFHLARRVIIGPRRGYAVTRAMCQNPWHYVFICICCCQGSNALVILAAAMKGNEERRSTRLRYLPSLPNVTKPHLCQSYGPFPDLLTGHARRRANAIGVFVSKKPSRMLQTVYGTACRLVVHTDAGIFVGRRHDVCLSHALLVAPPAASLAALDAVIASSWAGCPLPRQSPRRGHHSAFPAGASMHVGVRQVNAGPVVFHSSWMA